MLHRGGFSGPVASVPPRSQTTSGPALSAPTRTASRDRHLSGSLSAPRLNAPPAWRRSRVRKGTGPSWGWCNQVCPLLSSTTKEGLCAMAGKTDEVKGRAKEAVGSLTGDKDLKSEGKADRRAGEAKEKLDDAKDKIEEVIDKADDKVEAVIDRAKEALHRN